ncbi:hypothetical protein HPB48_015534 [Haemaphysalis longicornis]|uniref:Uncharacterized protein n=1 Tax=Haemaphysalis longicornis TaxID=44386 RepID=A0A9J6FJF8_HAELO|nr:hypothetical protein HPB48_015534 [Haemaphysalis longicornis]
MKMQVYEPCSFASGHCVHIPARVPQQPEEDNELNQARITALLSLPGSVLVGTAQGFLIIYHLMPRCTADSRTDSSTEAAPAAKHVVSDSSLWPPSAAILP